MSLKNFNARTWVLILILLVAAGTRFIPLMGDAKWFNFTPVGAIALFGGTYFQNRWKAYLVPLLVLFVSDIFINYSYTGQWSFFYTGMAPIYISFALMVFIGSLIKKVSVANVLLASLGGVLVHWLVTDIPGFAPGLELYSRDLSGYSQALVAAIPFEKNLLLGNLVFGALLYGGFELAKSRYGVLKSNKQLA